MKTLATFLFFVLLSSCSISKKAHQYFNDHPEEFAKECADEYPCLDSTSNRVDTFIKAVNRDYTGAIDSLSNSFDSLRNSKYEDSVLAAISHDKCKEVVNDGAKKINSLKAVIQALKDSYKPCNPDTVKITANHYMRNTARESQYQQERDKERGAKEIAQGKLKNRTRIMWFLIIAIALFMAYKIFSKRLPNLKSLITKQ